MQSAWEMQILDQGVKVVSASSKMNLHGQCCQLALELTKYAGAVTPRQCDPLSCNIVVAVRIVHLKGLSLACA